MNAITQNTAASAPVWKAGSTGGDTAAAGMNGFADALGQLLGTNQTDDKAKDSLLLSLEALISGLSPLLQALFQQTDTVDTSSLTNQLQDLLQQHPEIAGQLAAAAQGFPQWAAKVEQLYSGLIVQDQKDLSSSKSSTAESDQMTIAPNADQAALQTMQHFMKLLQTQSNNPFVQQLSEDLQVLIASMKPTDQGTAGNVQQQAAAATVNGQTGDAAGFKLDSAGKGKPSEQIKPELVEKLQQAFAAEQGTTKPKPLSAVEALAKLEVLAARLGHSGERVNPAPQTDSGKQTSFSNDDDHANAPVFLASHNAPVTKTSDPANAFPKPVSAEQFVQEMNQFVVKGIKVNPLNGFSEAKLTLTPENLGQVDVKISVHNGQIVAQFTASTQSGREMIESQLAQLKSTLQSQGLFVDKLEVTQSANLQSGMFHDQRQQQAFQQFGRQPQQQSGNYEQGTDEFDKEISSVDGIELPGAAGVGFDATV